MTKMFAAILGLTVAATVTPAHAEPAVQLPLVLAMEAVDEAVRACSANGHKVAVAVVDPDGVIKAEVRGDGSPIHSQRFSFRKAFTVVSMGPMLGADTSSGVIKFITSNNPAGIANVGAGNADLLFLPGGVLMKSGTKVLGAIGVSGAPLSTQDEACAQAEVAKIQDRLDHGT